MSTSDIFDVLNIKQKPKTSTTTTTKAQQTPQIPQVTQRSRTTGLQRELYNLLGDSQPPILIKKDHGITIPSSDTTVFKERLSSINNKVTPWTHSEFKPTEKSRIRLRHWVRAVGRSKEIESGSGGDDDTNASGIEVSEFARFDQSLSVPTFSEEEYTKFMVGTEKGCEDKEQTINTVDGNSNDTSSGNTNTNTNDNNNKVETEDPWTYEEVKYLFDMCQRYDLRWYVISDRYSFKDTKRSLEDLKRKFYQVSKKYFQARDVAHPLLAPLDFPYEREVERKQYLERLLSRTASEIAEEKALIVESKKFEMAARRILSERESMLRLLDSPNSTKSVAQYMTSSGITQLYNSLLSNKSRRRKYEGGVPENPWMKQQRQEQTQAETTEEVATRAKPKPKPKSKPKPKQKRKFETENETKPTTTSENVPVSVPPELAQHKSEPKPEPEPESEFTSQQHNEPSTLPETTFASSTTLPLSASTKATTTTRLTKKQKLEQQTVLKRRTEAAYVEQLLHSFSAEERKSLGVTAHGEKLTPGVFLRSSRISTFKPALQNKVEAVLHELKLPVRPAMPSQQVVQQHEQLLKRIVTLIDLKRQLDRLGAERAIAKP